MIGKIMIPLAAFAVTVTGVSAFNGDWLSNAGLTDGQVAAFEQAHEVREASREEARAILENAGIDEEVMQNVREARHEWKKQHREQMNSVLESGDYSAFLEAVADTHLAEVVDTEAEFEKFMEAHELRVSGDHEGARAIMDELGIEKKGGFGKGGHGKEGFGMRGVQ